jgi:hypothetical protein
MSRAKAAAERVALDFYATPDALALAICQHVATGIATPRAVVEPSAGRGAFVRAIRATWPDSKVMAVEIDPENLSALWDPRLDVVVDDWARFATAAAESLAPPDLIIGNPPYRQAQEHVEAGLRWLRPGGSLAFLLRINFLGSTSRVDFWNRAGLASVTPITPRPSFTNGGTDGTEYAVFVWTKGHTGPARLCPPLVWKPERKRRAA